VLSSPSGGGKSTIARHLLEARENVTYSISATTRPRRPAEEDGKHYHFLDRAGFERKIERGELLEWAEYGGHLYGTLRAEVERGLSAGRHVVLDIDVAGARQVRRQFPDSVHVFVLPPSAATLVQRLRNRNTEDRNGIGARMAIAARELSAVAEYDYIVVNDDFVEAVAHVAAILDVEERRVGRLNNLSEVVEGIRAELGDLTAPKE
jgi:guanylate kinase